MGQLHFITGEKGGVGKSMWCRALLEFLIKATIKYSFYDADRTSPDVGLLYEPEKYDKIIADTGRAITSSTEQAIVKDKNYLTVSESKSVAVATLTPQQQANPLSHIYFSEDEEDVFKADQLFIEAASGNIVIVNLPAQVEVIIDKWFKQRGILEYLLDDETTKVYFWFVTDGSPESLELLEHSITTFGKPISHIVVRNWGLSKRVGESLALHRVGNFINKLNIPIVDMPELMLSKQEMRSFKTERIKLSDLADWKQQHSQFTILVKQRAKTFLDKCFASIDEIGVFNDVIAQRSSSAVDAPKSTSKKGRKTKTDQFETVVEPTTIPNEQAVGAAQDMIPVESPLAVEVAELEIQTSEF